MKNIGIITKLLTLFFLTSCASTPQWYWYKAKATEADFNVAKFKCMQIAQQPYAESSTFNSGGIISPQAMTTKNSSAGIATNWELYEACLNADGWKKQIAKTAANSNIKPSNTSKITKRVAEDICENAGYKRGTYPFEQCIKNRTE